MRKKELLKSSFLIYFKKTLDKSGRICYIIIRKGKENKKMAKKTQGWYTFADGYTAWFHGLSARERKEEIRKHGEIIKFQPT